MPEEHATGDTREGAGRPARKPLTPSERKKVHGLVERSGIPFVQAVQVVRGKVTLDDVLKRLWINEKRDRLVEEGLEPVLAGQVAHGTMDRDRAEKVQRLLKHNGMSRKKNRLDQMVGGPPVALALFERGMVGGVLADRDRYGIRLDSGESDGPLEIKKHDIKFFCLQEDAADVLVRIGRDEEIAALGLSSTDDIKERFRPDVETALDWIEARKRLVFFFRDGDKLAGRPLRVGCFEIEIDVGEGVRATIFSHALYKPRPFNKA